jgi:hypothetical protein
MVDIVQFETIEYTIIENQLSDKIKWFYFEQCMYFNLSLI